MDYRTVQINKVRKLADDAYREKNVPKRLTLLNLIIKLREAQEANISPRLDRYESRLMENLR